MDEATLRFTLDQVHAFLAVVDHHSFSAGARAAGKAQPAITQLVRSLEARLGQVLFDRSGYRPALTPEGKALLPFARRLAGEAEALQSAASTLAQDDHRITLTVDHGCSLARVAAGLRTIREKFVRLQVTCFSDALDSAPRRVLSGGCELGIVSSFSNLPDEVSRVAVSQTRFVLVVAPDHALGVMREVELSQLRLYDQLVLIDHAGEVASRKFGILSPRIWQVGDLMIMRHMLVAGLGFAVVPEHVFADIVSDGRLAAITTRPAIAGLAVPAPNYAIWRGDVPLSSVARALIDHLSTEP